MAKRVRLTWEGDRIVVEVDGPRLREFVSNFLRNEIGDDELDMTFGDQGVGMPNRICIPGRPGTYASVEAALERLDPVHVEQIYRGDPQMEEPRQSASVRQRTIYDRLVAPVSIAGVGAGVFRALQKDWPQTPEMAGALTYVVFSSVLWGFGAAFLAVVAKEDTSRPYVVVTSLATVMNLSRGLLEMMK